MNRNVSAQISYDRLNKGVDIRDPSTANFLIDSTDRDGYNSQTVFTPGVSPTVFSSDFTITKPSQNLITGFFTRFALTEIELAWNIQNVTPTLGNNRTDLFLVNGGVGVAYSVTIAAGNYTVEEGLNAILASLNAIVNGWTLDNSTAIVGKKRLVAPAGYTFNFYRSVPVTNSPNGVPNLNLAQALGFLVYSRLPTVAETTFNYNIAANPNLLAYEYIDITCPQLASQQKVKDATTSSFDANDIVFRWHFASDASYPESFDGMGYPILPGYKPFNVRRYLAFPKQIRWDPLLPLGQIQFTVYTDRQNVLSYKYLAESVEFKMLMLISEV
jgi:hypothetical protein